MALQGDAIMPRRSDGVLAVISAAWLLALAPHQAAAQAPASPPEKLVVFDGPSVNHDSVWMAEAKGFYKAEGLDVDYKVFPSGVAAFQAFHAGQGDIIMNGELNGLQHWRTTEPDYRVVLNMESDAKSYIAVVKNSIKTPQDLKGKILATNVGSTGSWFVSEYLAKNGIAESDVTIKNLGNQLLPVTLCHGDIDGYFIWQPTGTRTMEICGSQVHYLSTAEGYVRGYNLAGARAQWLATPEGHDAAMRFVRATMKGAKVAEKDFNSVYAYAKAKYGMSQADVREQYDYLSRSLAFDHVFFADFCSLSEWAQHAGLIQGKSNLADFVWTDGVKAVDPKIVIAAPPPC